MTGSSKSAFAVRRGSLTGLHRHGVWLHKLLELSCRVNKLQKKTTNKNEKKKGNNKNRMEQDWFEKER